jgi:hypothetical protein
MVSIKEILTAAACGGLEGMRRAGISEQAGVERCPLLEAKQKTSALSEYFAF